MLDRWVDVELVWREHDAAQCAADIRADYAKHCGCDPTHGLSAGHDSSRNQTDDETENDQPDDVQDHDESPLIADCWQHCPGAAGGCSQSAIRGDSSWSCTSSG